LRSWLSVTPSSASIVASVHPSCLFFVQLGLGPASSSCRFPGFNCLPLSAFTCPTRFPLLRVPVDVVRGSRWLCRPGVLSRSVCREASSPPVLILVLLPRSSAFVVGSASSSTVPCGCTCYVLSRFPVIVWYMRVCFALCQFAWPWSFRVSLLKSVFVVVRALPAVTWCH